MIININYNLKRHIELLKQEKKILNEKKIFFERKSKRSFRIN